MSNGSTTSAFASNMYAREVNCDDDGCCLTLMKDNEAQQDLSYASYGITSASGDE